ncbi:PLP-dependent cysteine synthase family protein [Streptomyces sp. NPDC003710]
MPLAIADSITDLVGSTPLLRLRPDGVPDDARILAKLESANPLSSIKDRIALFMLRAAEERGELLPDGTVVESTSGNTGIALAALATARGHRCVIVLPDNATAERVMTLRMLGAEVEFTDHTLGFAGCVERAEKLHAEIPGSWYASQHTNPDNVRAHYSTTGPEIWDACGGRVDYLVCGVGTGGTLTGTARFLRERNPDLKVVAVEPTGSALLSGGPPGPHRIPGLNGGFISPVTDVDLVDEVIAVSDDDAAATTRMIAARSGLLVGISSGAAAYGCAELARRHDLAGATVVTVFPDTGERYLSWWPAAGAEGDERS